MKQAGKLRTKTSLEPITRNVTRWSSTYTMLQRFFILQEFIDQADLDIAANFPSATEMITLKSIMTHLEQFETTTKLLQDFKRNLSEVRSIFDELLKHYPAMVNHIGPAGSIVHSPFFENAIVKVIEDEFDSLDDYERVLMEPFRQANAAASVGASPEKPDTPYAILALKKRER